MLYKLTLPISWKDLVKRTAREVQADNCLNLAAQLAFYFFLALFPALLFLVALLSFLPTEKARVSARATVKAREKVTATATAKAKAKARVPWR